MTVPIQKEEVLNTLEPFLELLFPALESGYFIARGIEKNFMDKFTDKHYFLHTVRRRTREFLKDHFQEIDDSVINLERLQMSGLSFMVDGINVRIRKKGFDGIPKQSTEKWKDFCRQKQTYQPSLPIFDDDEESQTSFRGNILILWLEKEENELMDYVEIYCPTGSLDSTDQYYWRTIVKKPVDDWKDLESPDPEEQEYVDPDELSELPFQKRRKSKVKKGS